MNKITVFLDRDGVINEKMPEEDYVKSWDEFKFLPRVKEALRKLKKKDIRVIIITNQRGIALGLMTEHDLHIIHKNMTAELAREGVSVDAVYYCPHDKGRCSCRKPDTGMFLQAKEEFTDIDFKRSFMVGDSISDMKAGSLLGCRNILVAEGVQRNKILSEASENNIAIYAVFSSLHDAITGEIF